MSKKTTEINTGKLSELAGKIAEKIEYTQAKGKLSQKRAASSFSTVSTIFTPEHTNKDEKIPALYHVEFRAPNGKILSIRRTRDLEAFLYLQESPRTLQAMVDIASSALTLNPRAEMEKEEPEDSVDYY